MISFSVNIRIVMIKAMEINVLRIFKNKEDSNKYIDHF